VTTHDGYEDRAGLIGGGDTVPPARSPSLWSTARYGLKCNTNELGFRMPRWYRELARIWSRHSNIWKSGNEIFKFCNDGKLLYNVST